MSITFLQKLLKPVHAFAFGVLLFVPLSAAAEQINAFDVTIDVTADGVFSVTEEIRYDFGDEMRHGIFRAIPTSHPQKGSSLLVERYIDIELMEVRMDGRPAPYTAEERSNDLYIRIEDPDIEITGEHTYVIVYEVHGGLTYDPQNGVTEIYWNATGNNWDTFIKESSVVVRSSDGVLDRARSCYTGEFGEKTSCVISDTEEGGVHFAAQNLVPNEGLTIAHELKSDEVAHVTLERTPTPVILLGLLALWLIALAYGTYVYKTRFKTHRPEIVQYEPYREVKPMLSGVLRDGTLHPQDITAGILHLADQGFLKIKTTKEKVFFFSVSDHVVELRRSFEEASGRFDRWLLSLMFNDDDPVGTTVKLSYLRHNAVKQTDNRKTLRTLKKYAMEDLTTDGFYEAYPTRYTYLGVGGLVASAVLFFVGIAHESLSVGIGAVFPFSAAIAWLLVWPRRTQKGHEAAHHLRGFEQYLSVTGEERFRFHSAPEKNPAQFIEYLPYAVAFGVEDEWAEVFEGVTIPSPGWYEGGAATLHARDLTDGIHTFSDSFASSSGTSSTSSASSGGGFSGGGAGGGGGGSI